MKVGFSLDTATIGARPVGGVVHDRLVERRAEMLSWFRRRLASPEDAEDALQDACLKAIRAAPSLDRIERADAWIGRIMRHTLVDHYRRRAARRRGEQAYALEVLVLDEAEQAQVPERACRCVDMALAALPRDQSRLLRRDLDDGARACLASDIGITGNALRVRLHRARQALRVRIGDLCPTCGSGDFAECDCGSLEAPVNALRGGAVTNHALARQ